MARPISRDELRTLMDRGAATVVETLPLQYYEQGHLPGALHLGNEHVAGIAPRLLPALAHPAWLALLTLLLLLRAKAAVEQLLLALHQLAHAAHHLLRLARSLLRHLTGPGHAQVFEHVLQL